MGHNLYERVIIFQNLKLGNQQHHCAHNAASKGEIELQGRCFDPAGGGEAAQWGSRLGEVAALYQAHSGELALRDLMISSGTGLKSAATSSRSQLATQVIMILRCQRIQQ